MTCTICGQAAQVKYVRYQPFVHVYHLCGACALMVLWDAPGRAWVRGEVIAEAEAILESA